MGEYWVEYDEYDWGRFPTERRMSVLMGIDPGKSTGVAYKIDQNYHTCTITDVNELWMLLREFKPDAVGFESFATGGRVDVNMIHTIEVVGSIRGICWVYNIRAFGQQPQARKSFLLQAQEILKNQSGKTIHERDALAHLLLLEHRIREGLR